jgi:hypothetical protein
MSLISLPMLSVLLGVFTAILRSRLPLSWLLYITFLFSIMYGFNYYSQSLWAALGDILYSRSDQLYNQIIGKTQLFFDGQSESDMLRIGYLSELLSNPHSFLLPHGFGYTAMINNVQAYRNLGFHNIVDNVYSWVAVQYGLIPLLLLLIYLIYRSFFFLRLYLKNRDFLALQILSILLTMPIYFYTIAFLGYPINSAITGLFFGSMEYQILKAYEINSKIKSIHHLRSHAL